MKKSLLAIAIAAALPAVASAQVTISGYAKGSFDSFSISGKHPDRTGKTSETRVTDHSSRIIFGAAEQINSDLTGVFQFDLRFNVDQQGRASPTETAAGGNSYAVLNQIGSGNNHVGIVSKSMGSLRVGRQDIYYGDTGSVLPSSTHINASAPTVLHNPGGTTVDNVGNVTQVTQVSMASHSRTPNLLWYTSPRIGGIEATVGYSTNPLALSGTNQTENDLTTPANVRRGQGTFARLNAIVDKFSLTWATVDLKSDYFATANQCGLQAFPSAGAAFTLATAAVPAGCTFDSVNGAQANQKGNVFTAIYRNGPIALGAGYSMNEATTTNQLPSVAAGATAAAVAAAGPAANVKTERNAFLISGAYTMGNLTAAAEYQSGGDISRNNVKIANSGLTGTVLALDYAFSKRTNVGLTYFVLKNDTVSNMGPFYSTSNTFGGQFTSRPGEDYKLTSVVMRHTW